MSALSQLRKGSQVDSRQGVLPWGSEGRERSQKRPQAPVPDIADPATQNPSMSGWDNRMLKWDVGEKGGSTRMLAPQLSGPQEVRHHVLALKALSPVPILCTCSGGRCRIHGILSDSWPLVAADPSATVLNRASVSPSPEVEMKRFAVPLLFAVTWAVGVTRALSWPDFLPELPRHLSEELPETVDLLFETAQQPGAVDDEQARTWILAAAEAETRPGDLLEEIGLLAWLREDLSFTLHQIYGVLAGRMHMEVITLDFRPLKAALRHRAIDR